MKNPVQIIVSVLESRRSEAHIKDMVNPKSFTQSDETSARRIARRLNRGESQRCFDDSGEECMVL